MRIALAQIDMRLGDIEGICARIESQARIARDQGADLLVTPAPLFGGTAPGGLIEERNYEHALLSALADLAGRLAALGIVAVVLAPVSVEHMPVLEAFLLREGRTVPLRSLYASRRTGSLEEMWFPPVFEVAGTRIAVTYDPARDMPVLAPGCDLVLFPLASSFDAADEATAAVASLADGHTVGLAREKGVWLACLAPVGAFDEAVFLGGSFVLDDAGRCVAAAPPFEEALLVQDIERGKTLPALEPLELPHYRREAWTWEALRLYVRDSVDALGSTGAVLTLAGDLPSSLAAVLAVDALGPRNVTGLLIGRSDMRTPAQEELEVERTERARTLAQTLGIRLIERAPADAARLIDRDAPALGSALARERLEGLYLEDAAFELGAVAVSALTKTDFALAAPLAAGGYTGAIAPFGDVYLTQLEFLARERNRAGAAVPAPLVTLNAVEDRMAAIVAAALAGAPAAAAYRERMAHLMAPLEPAQIDGVLEAHLERSLALDEIPLAATAPDAVALLLMIVRAGEAARRRLPPAPMVSAAPFAERRWPWQLAWSDTGAGTEEPLTCAALVEAEGARFAEAGEEHGRLVRSEIMGLVARMLGIPTDDMDAGDVEGELMRRMQQAFESAAEEGHPPFSGGHPQAPGGRPQGFSFFSDN